MTLVLKQQTVGQFVSRVREAYRNGSKDTLVNIARFLIAKVKSGDLTELQIRNAFGMTLTQWNTFKVKMQDLIAADDIVKSAQGE